MELSDKRPQGSPERITDIVFRLMSLVMDVTSIFRPSAIGKRVKNFGIEEGMTVVGYGCGPGRYTLRFSRLVGDAGKVYAVDIHELAIAAIKQKIVKAGRSNIEPVLARGYCTSVPDHAADVVCALDMFFMAKEPAEFLRELGRIAKPDGALVIDDGHQPREATKRNILASGLWRIEEESKDHLKCRPNRSS